MVLPQDCICVGRIAKLHGYKGAVRIDVLESILLNKPKGNKEPVFLMINQKPVPFFYTAWQDNMGNPIVHFEDIDDEPKAKELLGLEVFVAKTWVDEDEGSGIANLINFTVVDATHGKLGFISNYMENPGQTLLYMLQNGRETLIPFVDDIIIEVDWENEIIHTQLPDGLLDI
jgi:16S rRNA processing protein RimM